MNQTKYYLVSCWNNFKQIDAKSINEAKEAAKNTPCHVGHWINIAVAHNGSEKRGNYTYYYL